MKHTNKSFIALLAIALLASSCSQKAENTTTKNLPPIAVDASKPHFEFAASDLAVPADIGTNGVGTGRDTIVVHLKFSAGKTAEFAKFTQEHMEQQTQLIIGSTVVAEPRVIAVITDGRCDLTFKSVEKAQAVEDLLNGN